MSQKGQKVQCGMVVQSMADSAQQYRVLLEAAVLDGGVQTHVILGHHAAGAQVGMPGLGVAGFALAQAYMGPGGVEAAPGLLG